MAKSSKTPPYLGPEQSSYSSASGGYPTGSTGCLPESAEYPPGTIGYQPKAYGPKEVVLRLPGAGRAPADDNLLLSVVSCFCCTIIGVVAILYSCLAREANKRRDYERARRYGSTALRIAVLALAAAGICGSVGIVMSIVKKYK